MSAATFEKNCVPMGIDEIGLVTIREASRRNGHRLLEDTYCRGKVNNVCFAFTEVEPNGIAIYTWPYRDDVLQIDGEAPSRATPEKQRAFLDYCVSQVRYIETTDSLEPNATL